MELIAINFYASENLEKDKRMFGHWSRLKELSTPIKNAQLFGSHSFALKRHRYLPIKKIYIYRDGRDVAFSMWNSEFFDEKWGDISFQDYLRKNLDWFSTPTFKSDYNKTILEHWHNHVSSWLVTPDRFVLKLRYEEVVQDQKRAVQQIASFLNVDLPADIKIVEKLVGLSPNQGMVHKWKNHLDKEDYDYINKLVPNSEELFWVYPT